MDAWAVHDGAAITGLVHSLPTGFAPACPPVTRFAPSPNGRLHLGHGYAALAAHDAARAGGGRFLLRIEDIDGTRSRAAYIDAILADLAWLGLTADAPPLLQSTRLAAYRAALARLVVRGLAYRCFCTRADIARALANRAVRHGPDGPHYPGTCRSIAPEAAARRAAAGAAHAWRLSCAAALATQASPPLWTDIAAGTQVADGGALGDVVLWRRDAPASYHLASVVDDGWQNITLVVRGRDLFAYSGLHRLLQILLDLPAPRWWHHPLLGDGDGEKLAKSRRSPALADLAAAGVDGRDVAAALRRGALPPGLSLLPGTALPSGNMADRP